MKRVCRFSKCKESRSIFYSTRCQSITVRLLVEAYECEIREQISNYFTPLDL